MGGEVLLAEGGPELNHRGTESPEEFTEKR